MNRCQRFTILMILFLSAGCAVPQARVYEKAGKRYGVARGNFTGQWYDHYERGLSYTQGDYWEEALKDFAEASRLREKDQRRARTYGLHLMDYFPHREQGVCYYYLDRLEEAIEELESSLKAVDSAKAKYYLKKAREAWLKKSRKDQRVPWITLLSPAKGFLTHEFSARVSGWARDDYFVSDIEINGEPIWVELPEKDVPFEKIVPLEEGVNTVRVRVRDLSGKETLESIEILADRKGPMVGMALAPLGPNLPAARSGSLKSETPPPRSETLVKGYVYDRTGVERLTLNGVQVRLEEGKGAEFSQVVDLASAPGPIRYEAVDKVGNVTRGELLPSDLATLHPLSPEIAGLPRFASLKWARPNLSKTDTIVSDLSQPKPKIPPPKSKKDPMPPAPFRDPRPPAPSPGSIEIQLKDLAASQTVSYDRELIEVEVSSLYGIKEVEVRVNGRPQIIGEEGSYVSQLLKVLKGLSSPHPQKFSFSQLVELKEGKNEILVGVEDLRGNTGKQKVTITRKINPLKEIASRLSLLIYPAIDSSREIPEMKQRMINASFESSLVNLRRFNMLVEKEKRDEIFHEQKLSKGRSMNKDTAVELGRTKAAELVLFGDIFEDKRSITLKCSIVDVETTEIMADVDMFSEDKENIKILTEGLALKVARNFPMLEGWVIDRKEERELIVDIGSKNSGYLKRNMKYIIYREGAEIKHPVTGKILGKEIEVKGFARVEQVMEEFSLAKSLGKDKVLGIAKKDRVITK